MARPRVRWATGPDDTAAPNEIIGRLERDAVTREHYPGAGREAAHLVLTEDGLVAVTDPQPTDLHIARATVRMTVEHGDGRRLVARFGLDADAPQIDADAPPVLRDAVLRLWRQRPRRGAPAGSGLTFPRVVETVADLWPDRDAPPPTAAATAEAIGCTETWLSRVCAPAGGYQAAVEAARRD